MNGCRRKKNHIKNSSKATQVLSRSGIPRLSNVDLTGCRQCRLLTVIPHLPPSRYLIQTSNCVCILSTLSSNCPQLRISYWPRRVLMPTNNDARRDFNCKFCDRRFARLEHLQRHIRTRKPPAVFLSSRPTYTNSSVKDTKEKPFACTCGRSFARVDLLRRHSRLAHAGQSPSPVSTPVALPGRRDEEQLRQREDFDSSTGISSSSSARVVADHVTRFLNMDQPHFSDVRMTPASSVSAVNHPCMLGPSGPRLYLLTCNQNRCRADAGISTVSWN